MYDILLTDDEQIMIDSLTFIIGKNFSEQVRLFTALSGSEALEVVAKNQIDIIFMDINMPGLNGLETVRYITQAKPDTVVIMLSAFDQFQYAQEAVNLGAFKYLTKPVNRNTVIETVRSAMAMVDKRRGLLSNEVELHKKLDLVSPMVESDFIYSAAFSGSKDITEYFSYFEITDCVWCFCCLEIPRMEAKNQYDTYMKIRDTLTGKCRCIIGSFMMNRIVIFFYFPHKTVDSAAVQDIKGRLHELYKLLSIHISSGIRGGVSGMEMDSANTCAAYNKALEVLNGVPDHGGLLFADESDVQVGNRNYSGELAEKIFGRIHAGDVAVMPSLIHSYCQSLQEKFGSNLNRIKNALFELLVNARNIVTEIDTTWHNEAFDNAFSVLSKEDGLLQLEQFVCKRCCECASAVMELSARLDNPIIERATAFIMEHMAENISLEETAQAVGVSSFYLSKLFKEEKNENYISFVTDVRMEKARSLLKDPRASIKEVSAAVGYNDQNYFSRIFRNKFGMTPTEFRDAAKK